MIWGLLELYQATFDTEYLNRAIELNKTLINHFWDEEDGGFFFTADDGEKVLLREKKSYDSAIPSGNSIELLNLLKIAMLTENIELESMIKKLESAFSEIVKRSPTSHTQFISGVDFIISPSYNVLIVGEENSEATAKILDSVFKKFNPNKVVIFKDINKPEVANKIAASIKHKNSLDGYATGYVCAAGSCKLPTTDPDEILKLLEK
jgi:uncharacterized protein